MCLMLTPKRAPLPFLNGAMPIPKPISKGKINSRNMSGCAVLVILRDTVAMKTYFTLRMRALNAEHVLSGENSPSKISHEQLPHVWR